MHPSIKMLAQRYQIPITDRVCGGEPIRQPVWNGRTLASSWAR